MSKLTWSEDGHKLAESGVEQVVYYPQISSRQYGKGEAWNGVTEISCSAEGGEASDVYAGDVLYVKMVSKERATGSITAYNVPNGFHASDGRALLTEGVEILGQRRKPFGLCYMTRIVGDREAYKIHVVYGCLASPAEKTYSTIGEETEPAELSWDFTADEVSVNGLKKTFQVEIDSRRIIAAKLERLKTILYGSEETNPRLPLVNELTELMSNSILDSSSQLISDSNGDILIDHVPKFV